MLLFLILIFGSAAFGPIESGSNFPELLDPLWTSRLRRLLCMRTFVFSWLFFFCALYFLIIIKCSFNFWSTFYLCSNRRRKPLPPQPWARSFLRMSCSTRMSSGEILLVSSDISTLSSFYPWIADSVNTGVDPGSVGDPDPSADPHVFGPPGSGSISQRYESGSGSSSGSGSVSFPFSHKFVQRTEIMPAK
jgi:hypothetical protein